MTHPCIDVYNTISYWRITIDTLVKLKYINYFPEDKIKYQILYILTMCIYT